MENNSYSMICKEVLAVLNKVPEAQLALIPDEIINYIKLTSEETDKETEIKFDIFGNPILSKEAKSMIVILYQKYFLDDRTRTFLMDKLLENDKENESRLKKIIKNNIFYD